MGKGSTAAKSQGNVTPFTPVEGPSAWYAADFKDNDTWIYRLTDSDIQEIEAAVAAARATKKEIKVSSVRIWRVEPTLLLLDVLQRAGNL